MQKLHILVMPLLFLGLACAAHEEAQCPAVSGRFQAVYLPIYSTCEPVTAYGVSLAETRSGVGTVTDINFNMRVSTEVVSHGCDLSVTQTALNISTGATEQIIQSDALSIDSETRVSGLVQIQKYDANNQPTCSGMYNAVLTQNPPVGAP